MIDLYHRTSADAAAAILTGCAMTSRENTQEAYFSTRPDGHATGYGTTVVHVRVPAHLARLDDEFPDGELHYRVRVADLRPEHFVGASRGTG